MKWTDKKAEEVLTAEAVHSEFNLYFDSDQYEEKPGYAYQDDIELGLSYGGGEWFSEMISEHYGAELQEAKEEVERQLGIELTDDEFLDCVRAAGEVAAGAGGYLQPGVSSKLLPRKGLIIIAEGADETEVEIELQSHLESMDEDEAAEFMKYAEYVSTVPESFGQPYAYEIVSIYWTVYVDPKLVEEWYS
jgi:hypothetical protein